MKTYRISLEVRVTDEQALFKSALKHAMEVDNLDEDFAREELTNGSGSIDVESCLQMIFDPGESPGGASIDDSSVECVHSSEPDAYVTEELKEAQERAAQLSRGIRLE